MKLFVSALLALAFAASAASASGRIDLRLDDCPVGFASRVAFSDCASNAGHALALVASAVLPAPFADFVGAEARFDVQADAPTVPDGWRLDPAGCRAGAGTPIADASITPSCPTIWDGHPGALAQLAVLTQADEPSLPAGRVRLIAAAALADSVPLLPGDGATEYGVLKLVIAATKSTGADSCGGCSAGACIGLGEILFSSTSPATPFLKLEDSTSLLNLAVVWQGGSSLCGSVPVRNRTWGAVKALYR